MWPAAWLVYRSKKIVSCERDLWSSFRVRIVGYAKSPCEVYRVRKRRGAILRTRTHFAGRRLHTLRYRILMQYGQAEALRNDFAIDYRRSPGKAAEQGDTIMSDVVPTDTFSISRRGVLAAGAGVASLAVAPATRSPA